MPLVRQRKKDRKKNKDTAKSIEIIQKTSENINNVKEPEIKKFLGDKTKSSLKKTQKIAKKRKNDSKYESIYSDFFI